MRRAERGGGLLGLLARYILIFTLALGTFAVLAVSWWGYQLTGLFYPCNWEGLLADSALGEGRYDALRGYLGQAGSFAVYEEGALIFASEDGFDPALTEGELSCIPVQGILTQVGRYEQTDETGASRTLVIRLTGEEEAQQARAVVLDGAGKVLWGDLGDGQERYTERELAFLTDTRFENCLLTRAAIPGTDRVVLLRERQYTEDEYMAQYGVIQRRLWILAPAFFGLATVWVLLLRRRIAKPLRRLDTAVTAQAAGRSVRVGDCGGPREIRRIGESFDRFARQLEESEAERRRMDEARQKMIADISHDIKTPVTVICGGIDAICDGKVPPGEVEPTLRMIRRRADTLAQLADSFHEYAKVNHPAFLLHTERTDVGEFLREYLAAKYDEIALAGFTLETDIPETPLWCEIDRLQLTRALDNLLSNALRHNRLGTALFVDAAREETGIVLRLADNGEGIPPARRERIFEPFVTGDDARTSPGSGLGLSIARQILERHGGNLTLTAHPMPPRVTEFVLTLPPAKKNG